jgi:hypothetical protein
LPLVGKDGTDPFYVKNSFEGIHIFGATGSGKTSGSGQYFAKSFLDGGYGGLVLTVKPTDKDDWIAFAKATNREDDLIIFNPTNNSSFNFLEYENSRAGQGAGLTENLVNLFVTVVEVAERGNKASGDAYWMRSVKHMLRNSIDLLKLANEDITLPNLYRLITSAPNSIGEIFKYCFQQAIERRKVQANSRPVFIWADEAQNFITTYDQNFLTTARSSRTATVYLTQNIPNYYAVLGSNGKETVNSLLGNFQTKIFHQNSDPTTNEYGSKLIGQRIQYRTSTNQSSANKDNKQGSMSMGTQESLEYIYHPHEFNYLAKGGEVSNYMVEAIIFQGGRVWSNNEIYREVSFSQKL